MRIGLIARMDNTGLGTQTWEAYRHLMPSKVMVIDYHMNRPGEQYPERYDSTISTFIKGAPSPQEINLFLKDLDIIFACETFYSFYIISRARELGVKTIVQPNFEFSPWMKNDKIPRPDCFGVPSSWHYKDFPEPKILLPVPIATDRFASNTSGSARKFLHIVGTPAANDRNGTRDLIAALLFVKSEIVVTITCQKPEYVNSLLRGWQLPSNVRIIIDTTHRENYWEVYQNNDILILPRRYGGLCLPVNEAIGAEMPVIMPDISPNNEWLPKEWLVKADFDFDFVRGDKETIDVYKVDTKELAKKIDKIASDRDFYATLKIQSQKLKAKNSWETLLPLYLETFETIIKS